MSVTRPVTLSLLLLTASLRGQTPPALQLGAPLPAWSITGPATLPSLLQGQKTVLLLLAASGPAADCAALTKLLATARPRLQSLGFSLLPLRLPGTPGCGSIPQLTQPLEKMDETLLIVDQDRILRRRLQGAKWSPTTAALEAEAKLWSDGQVYFNSQCARCHGEDGRDERYPGTKSLAGIGNRHSEEKILSMTELAAFVDLSYLKAEGKRALMAYVAGL